MRTKDFTAELWEIAASAGLTELTFVRHLLAGEIPAERIRAWAPQFCLAVDTFKRFIAQVYANCEPAEARELLAQNLFEEHGEGDPARDHTRLAERFLRALGATDDDLAHAEPMPELVAWRERCLRVCREEPFVAGLAGLTFAIEGASPAIMRLLGEAFRDRYGLPASELEYFFMHIDADEEHTRRGVELVERFADTEELREACRRAVREFVEATSVLARGFERLASGAGPAS